MTKEQIKHQAIEYATDKNGVIDTHIYIAYMSGYKQTLEIVKQEIERRLHNADYLPDSKAELQSIVTFIDSLQAEPKKDFYGLEEAIDRYESLIGGFESMSNHDCRNIARYFADWGGKWQKNEMLKEAVDCEITIRPATGKPDIKVNLSPEEWMQIMGHHKLLILKP